MYIYTCLRRWIRGRRHLLKCKYENTNIILLPQQSAQHTAHSTETPPPSRQHLHCQQNKQQIIRYSINRLAEVRSTNCSINSGQSLEQAQRQRQSLLRQAAKRFFQQKRRQTSTACQKNAN